MRKRRKLTFANPRFEKLRSLRVSPLKRGADLPPTVRGPLTGVVPGADRRDPRIEMRRLRAETLVADNPPVERRVLRPGAPVAARVAPILEQRWPTCAGTPFEFTPLGVGQREVLIAASDRLRLEDVMTTDEQLALRGAFITIEGLRREIRDVRPNDDGSCDLIIHPPIPLAAPVEVFEPIDVKGTAKVLTDTTLRFTPAKTKQK